MSAGETARCVVINRRGMATTRTIRGVNVQTRYINRVGNGEVRQRLQVAEGENCHVAYNKPEGSNSTKYVNHTQALEQ